MPTSDDDAARDALFNALRVSPGLSEEVTKIVLMLFLRQARRAAAPNN